MSTAQSYHDALSTLSGNAALADARNALLASISDNELVDVIAHGLRTGTPRIRLNTLATQRLDELVAARADAKTATQAEDEADVGGVQDGVRYNIQSQRGSGGSVERQDRPAVPAAKQISPPNAAANIAPQSIPYRKRKTEVASPAQNKRRLFIPEIDSEGELSFDPRNGSSDDEEEVNAQSKKLTSWAEVRSSSLMVDLTFIDSDDPGDKKHTESMMKLSPQMLWRSRMPGSEVLFLVPTRRLSHPRDYASFPFSSFPESFVKRVVRKFNEDYLSEEADRKTYLTMIDSRRDSGQNACVRRLLEGTCRSIQYEKSACDTCIAKGLFCARRERSKDGTNKLLIYPLPWEDRVGVSWKSMHFWGF